MNIRVFQAVNGPLQARTKVLQADLADAQRFPEDYQTDLESEFARLSKKRSSFSSSLIVDLDPMDDQSRNLYYQQQVSDRVSKQANDVVNLLTRALNIHLNLEQQFTLNTSNVFVSLEKLKGESLLGREIPSVDNARFRLPSRGNLSVDQHQSGLLRVRSSSSLPAMSLSISFSSVDIGTLGVVRFFLVEHESVAIDLFDLDG